MGAACGPGGAVAAPSRATRTAHARGGTASPGRTVLRVSPARSGAVSPDHTCPSSRGFRNTEITFQGPALSSSACGSFARFSLPDPGRCSSQHLGVVLTALPGPIRSRSAGLAFSLTPLLPCYHQLWAPEQPGALALAPWIPPCPPPVSPQHSIQGPRSNLSQLRPQASLPPPPPQSPHPRPLTSPGAPPLASCALATRPFPRHGLLYMSLLGRLGGPLLSANFPVGAPPSLPSLAFLWENHNRAHLSPSLRACELPEAGLCCFCTSCIPPGPKAGPAPSRVQPAFAE